jgi:hypothetical protein
MTSDDDDDYNNNDPYKKEKPGGLRNVIALGLVN